MGRLEGKTAIVTGAGSGIGAGIAKMFAKEGAKVVLVGWHLDKAEKTASGIRGAGAQAIAIKCDVSNAKEVKALVDAVIKRFKKIDILVNNAGVYVPHSVEDVSEKEWDKVMSIDLKGVMLCSKHVIPFMRKQGKGKIVNIASIAGEVGFAQSAAYCAAKGGVILLTKEMALDYAKERINVNAICPGIIVTAMTKDMLKDKKTSDALMQQTPVGRFGQPEDIAFAAVYLASDESDFVTGETLIVDGGWTIK
ncbi:short-chain dehydrogenase [Candidatus Micrarchaeota archaeon CG09_land_8_20_14_0_10_55_25]|nr:MAG: hypothetical protein AUJ15_01485 [Candidatus Micrarchaeota archaeon CG1_02_55_41]PIO02585.1 MAG: short-chain dehydrogenase [Candidatus Micrarchaeota archaeon CG09_land_8_20_14_0_10_55_25]